MFFLIAWTEDKTDGTMRPRGVLAHAGDRKCIETHTKERAGGALVTIEERPEIDAKGEPYAGQHPDTWDPVPQFVNG